MGAELPSDGFFEVLVVLQVRPVTAPGPAGFLESLDYVAVFEDRTRVAFGPVEIRTACGRGYIVTLHVGIGQRIDIDRSTPAVIGEPAGPASDVAAIECRRVICRHR